MKTEIFVKWFTALGEAWCNREPQKAAELFSKDVEYYESTLEKPCNSWEEVLKLWLVVPTNQKNITYDFELVSTTDNWAVANWKMTRTLLPSNKKQKIDGIFLIKLNEEGKCNYFKQWRTVQKF